MNIITKFWKRQERRSVEVSPELLAAIEASQEYGVYGEEALKCSGILACLRFLSETLAQLPLKVYERDPKDPDSRSEAVNHPLYSVLGYSPNQDMTSFEWRERMVLDLCIFGDTFNQIVMNGKFDIREIVPLSPKQVTVERNADRIKIFRYGGDDLNAARVFKSEEILQVPIMLRGLRGRSLVDLAAKTVKLAMSAEDFASRFFSEGADLRMVYSVPANLSYDKVKEVAEFLRAEYGGLRRQNRPMVAPGGATVSSHQSQADKLQLIETRKFQLEEIARCMRVPQHIIGLLDRSTNNNIEHQGIETVTYCIGSLARRFEQRFQMSLFGERESNRYYSEFDLDGLQRGDFKSRVEGMAQQISTAQITPNESRKKFNRPPVEGGDELYIQGAMVPLRMAGAKQTQPATAQPGGQV